MLNATLKVSEGFPFPKEGSNPLGERQGHFRKGKVSHGGPRYKGTLVEVHLLREKSSLQREKGRKPARH